MPIFKRNPISQSKHDRKVLQIAREYGRSDYEVYADIAGYLKPSLIGGYRPDVIAIKYGHITIVEVETTDSLNTAHANAQDSAFRRARRRSATTKYRRFIA